ncbi:EVE domain-containing protein [Sorangium sp. So ce426]|uniref:EVE domain-containing protein n=1 Tax=Sorangium sp. So ce426 TaxID=3133312 RepID=UPI003F5C2FFB
MRGERKPGEPWNEQTFFPEAEARSAAGAAGLRSLFDEAMSLAGNLDVVWGKGDMEPRFIIRQGGSSAGDLVSGWASGQVGVYVAVLRDIDDEKQRLLDRLAAALGVPDWVEAKEPTFDAELLEQREVATAMRNLLFRMAGLDGSMEGHRWALFASPDTYRVEDAVRDRAIDTWTTAGRPMKIGDRVLVWRGKGRGGRRGVVAFGEVVEGPRGMPDHENPYWVTPPGPGDVEDRVRVRYVTPPGLPLWFDEHEDVLSGLSIARERGGTVFNVTPEQWETVVAAAGGWTQRAPVPEAMQLGSAYRHADETNVLTSRAPFVEVDFEKIERGNYGHAKTQNALADFLQSHGLQPRSPSPSEPEYDLAWKVGTTIFVAEVKSITDMNEERQLRLGLGQVLWYAHLLKGGGRTIAPVLVAEREPRDPRWGEMCEALGVRLVWPDTFASALDERNVSSR